MKYSILGRTGYKVSCLGFGAMRLPMKGEQVDRDLAIPMIHRAFEAGVNYIDSAVMYCRNDSERTVGEALKGWRDKIVVSTKNNYLGEDEKAWRLNLDNSLQRLQVDNIDIYNIHGLNKKNLDEAVRPRIIKWLTRAKDEGLIKHICTSFHDDNQALREIIDSDFFDCITIQYNLLDRQLEDGIAHARAKNIGVVVMGPVGGGKLAASTEALAQLLPEVGRIPELALRFVWSNPDVNVALSGMSTMQQVEENIALATERKILSGEESRIVHEQLDRLKKAADLYCTGCNYCLPCPQDVKIPAVFSLYNQARVYGLWDHARKRYADWRKTMPQWNQGVQPDSCTECGQCEEKCPQKIPIRQQLKEAHAALSSCDTAS